MISLDDSGALQESLKEKVASLGLQPEFHWHDDEKGPPYHVDKDGSPAVRVGVANAPLDTDVWRDLRSPAAVGLHPLGFGEIWDFYAANNIRNVRRDGSPNYLAMPETFEEAKERFKRAVVVSALLPIAPRVFEAYAEKIVNGDMDSYDGYSRASADVGKLVSGAVAKLSVALLAKGRAVVCMNSDGVKKVAEFSLSKSETGKYHGPCNNPFPQPSIAVLTGLMQFGVSRLPLRDELNEDGRAVRLMGHYSSVVVFDGTPPVTDGRGGVVGLDPVRLEKLRRLSDFTVIDEKIVAERFCAYNRTDGGGRKSVCGKCINYCPSGAIANSTPSPDGSYPEAILKQKHRFHRGFLDFDFGNCSSERGSKQNLYSEYACARCVAVCAARGISGLGR